jgi:hypothetical protein
LLWLFWRSGLTFFPTQAWTTILLFWASPPHWDDRHTLPHPVFAPYSPSFSLSPHPSLPLVATPDSTCSALLFSDFIRKKMTFLFV